MKHRYKHNQLQADQAQFEPLAVRIPDACRMIGIGRSKLYQLINDGEIDIVKVGSMTIVPVEGLKKFIANQSWTHSRGDNS